jgi:nucleoside recognition membrane protein YjiH
LAPYKHRQILISHSLLIKKAQLHLLELRYLMPIFKTPGKSAVDAVASFVGSYSLGLLITNRVYKQGMYNKREATINNRGFSFVVHPLLIDTISNQ